MYVLCKFLNVTLSNQYVVGWIWKGDVCCMHLLITIIIIFMIPNFSFQYYRAVESLLPTNGLVRIPCGVCPVYKNCHDTLGAVNPVNCQYLTEWMPWFGTEQEEGMNGFFFAHNAYLSPPRRNSLANLLARVSLDPKMLLVTFSEASLSWGTSWGGKTLRWKDEGMLPENFRFCNFINQIVISIFYGFRIRLDGTSRLITFGCVICNDYDFSRSRSGLSTTEFGAIDPDHLGELCCPGV